MSLTHWLVVALLVLLLFGRGKISDLMGDLAKGIKSFKKGMAEEDEAPAAPPPPPAAPRTIDHQPATPAPAQPAPVAEPSDTRS
jgi:sec-independent protein translocase protein TatA